MTAIFLGIVNMSITGSVIALVIIALRFLLRKAPKKYSYILWGILGIRLLCPFSFSSILSVFNILKPKVSGSKMAFVTADTSKSFIDIGLVHATPAASQTQSAISQSSDIWQALLAILSAVWIIGIIVFTVYFICSCAMLRKRLAGAERLYDNVYESKSISTAFVFGLTKPAIYLPCGTQKPDVKFIVAHEKAHIKRLDHIIKLIAVFILCLHWFNPVIWLAYKLMSADMELSCDELAIASFDRDIKKDYANALLRMSAKQSGITLVGMLAFGENSTKSRISGVLSAKKPLLIVTVAAAAVVAISAVCLLSNGADNNEGDTDSVINNISENENSENLSTPDTLTDNTDTENATPTDTQIPANKPLLELTEENAQYFVSDVLSSFAITKEHKASFVIPDIIPSDTEGKTKLTITLNATYVEGAGSYSVNSVLDYKTGWLGGEVFTADLTADSGRLHSIMLRVAFMTEIDMNTSSQFYADYITLEEPFDYNSLTNPVLPKTELSLSDNELFAYFTTKSDDKFSLSMTLPEGVTAETSDVTNGFSEIPSVEFFRNGQSVGVMNLIGYGATDDETLMLVDTSSADMPMMIYSPIALSNVVDYHNGYTVVSHTDNSSNAICYPVDMKTDYHNDCVLAFDLSSGHYFAMLSFAPDILTQAELFALAQSISFS